MNPFTLRQEFTSTELGSLINAEMTTPHYFHLSHDDLAQVLRRPFQCFIELGERAGLEKALTQMQSLEADFALSLTSPSVWNCPTPQVIAKHLCSSFGIQEHRCLQMETCLQEALANAVMHGNLGMESGFASAPDMLAHHEKVRGLLQLEPYRNLRVRIAAWGGLHGLDIAITDEGAGFPSPPNGGICSQDEPDPATSMGMNLPHGRGLMLINAVAKRVWLGSNRRTLCMTIAY